MRSDGAAWMPGIDATTPAVVLTCCDHLGLGLVRSLGRLGAPVYCIDPNPGIPAMQSRYIRERFVRAVVEAPAAGTVDFLLGLGRRLGRRALLIHTSDATAMFVADNARALAECFIFPDQSPSLVRNVSSKKGMYFLAKQEGIPTAETAFPTSRAEVVEALEGFDFPVMLKGIDGLLLEIQSGKRMYIVRTREDLLALYDRIDPAAYSNIMLQEYIPGGEDSVWMFNGYFNKDSDCLLGITAKKIRQAPAYTGYTSLGVCLPNAAVEASTKDFMKRIGYRGMLDVGFRYDARDGRYKVLDVNPRIGATFRLFVGDNGMDVARAAYLDLTGQPVPPSAIRTGRRWLLEDLDLKSSLTYYRDGNLSFGEWIRSFRGLEETAYFASDDLRPYFRMGTNHVRKIFRRILGRNPS